MLALLLIASAPLPAATSNEMRVARELDGLNVLAEPRYPGGPVVAVTCVGHPSADALRQLEGLPTLRRLRVGAEFPNDNALDLSRLRVTAVRVPSFYLNNGLMPPVGLRELGWYVAIPPAGYHLRPPEKAARESAELVRLVAQLPRLEALDLTSASLADGWLRRLASRSLRQLSITEGLPDVALLPALRSLTVVGPLDDTALAGVGRMTQLEELSLDHRAFTDRGMLALSGLTELRVLRLTGLPRADAIGDAGLAHLRSLRRLEVLEVTNTGLTDDGLAAFAGLSRLRDLSLEGNRVTGPGLARLSGLPIERLFLGGEPLRAEPLRHLAALPRLRMLDLSSSGEGRDLTPGLAAVRQVEVLSLNYTGATDDGLAHLPVGALREVRLHETRVGPEAAERLRRARPGLYVHRPDR